jgi:hypothetical protein
MPLEERINAGRALAQLFAWIRGTPLTGLEKQELYETARKFLHAEKIIRRLPKPNGPLG